MKTSLKKTTLKGALTLDGSLDIYDSFEDAPVVSVKFFNDLKDHTSKKDRERLLAVVFAEVYSIWTEISERHLKIDKQLGLEEKQNG